MTKTALITGISGQDGSYLAELLLEKNYRVVGLVKNNHSNVSDNIKSFRDKIEFVLGDLSDVSAMYAAIQQTQPDEVYNLASQSYPGDSWRSAIETMRTNGLGAHILFDTIRQLKPDCRIYQASSSEMFGEVTESPQQENTPFHPVNPYAAAKLYAHNIAKIYRKSYNMFISCGILFNHESERRGTHFITQKVSYAAACLKLGIHHSPLLSEKGDPIVNNGKLLLGNLDANRDWGYARDYVKAMWLMLQHSTPDDFVIGTGKIRTIRQLCEAAFSYVGLDWEKYVQVDPRFVRPTDTGPTVANPSKAKELLGWEASLSFEDLIARMVDRHLEKLSNK
ncbi:MAG TPA: GDP-mannose 4,6-dehydratase [Gammaproteobacteria bacterium]|nr:GDP-mannose 4,6-dehydratase [Gammaproteobacteria bacterium]